MSPEFTFCDRSGVRVADLRLLQASGKPQGQTLVSELNRPGIRRTEWQRGERCREARFLGDGHAPEGYRCHGLSR